MNIYQIKCPNCDANLEVDEDEGLDFVFCKYCGHKCAIDYEGMTTQINYSKKLKSDEHKLDKRLSHKERVLEMEYEEKKRKDKLGLKVFGIIEGVCLALIFLIFAISSCSDKKSAEREIEEKSAGNIKIKNSGYYTGENYEYVENTFRDLGFTSIESNELNEKTGAFSEPGDVKTITINGEEQWSADSYFPKDATVRIYYYGD